MWNKRVENVTNDELIIDTKIQSLKASAQATVDKIKYLSSEVAIKYLEADLVKAETEVRQLEDEKIKRVKTINTINMDNVMEHIGYFLEHIEELLIDTLNPLKRAAFFSLIFDVMPNYTELTSGTPKLAPFLALKERFDNSMVSVGDPTGNRTPISRMRICCPNH